MHGLGALRGVVALDGPSGTGKSTAARRLAQRLHARYLDTGAMYRAVALAALHEGVDPQDAAGVTALLPRLDLQVGTDPVAPQARLDGRDVEPEIRGPEVTVAVSPVSAIPEVRSHLVALQQRVIAAALQEPGGIVVEGRDIGTVVARDAALKVFLTADAQVRVQRRAAQDSAAGRATSVDDVRRSVDRRDRFDAARAASPLRPADDAVLVDTTGLDVTDVLGRLVELVSERAIAPGRPRAEVQDVRP